MIDAEKVQCGGVQILNVNGILGDVVAEVVGRSVGRSRLHSSAGHPDGETARMMVATCLGAVPFSLAGDATTEFAAPDYESVIEQAAKFQVFYEGGAWLVGIPAAGRAPTGKSAVVIPVGMKQLNEADTSFSESARENAVGGVAPGTP